MNRTNDNEVADSKVRSDVIEQMCDFYHVNYFFFKLSNVRNIRQRTCFDTGVPISLITEDTDPCKCTPNIHFGKNKNNPKWIY